MKRCPECRRDYYDDTLLYCLEDGTALVQGSVPSPDEPTTAILSGLGVPPLGGSGSAGDEGQTRSFNNTTEQTAIFNTGAAAKPPINLGDSAEKHSFSANRAAKPLAALVLAVLILVGGFFGYKYFAPAKQIESIAVMPFVNESGNADVEYLCDGMTETLISSLSQLANLNVKGRSSVFRYKGKDLDTKTLGKELGVQAVLNGRVIQRGEQLTLSLELLDAVTENVIWSGKYDRKQADVVSLQSEIARDVSNKLKSKLSGADTAKVEKGYTADPDAYRLYLQGRFYWNKRTAEDLKKSIGYFEQAIARDPGYALAYSGLGAVYQVIPGYTSDPPPEVVYPKARTFSLKALEIDPTLAEPHATLAVALHEYEWKHQEAESEFKRAIELDPNYPSSHQWYGNFLLNMGRSKEGVAEMERAIELDPLSPIINSNLAKAYRADHRYDDAIAQYKKTLELMPNFQIAQFHLGNTYILKGMYEEAIDIGRQLMLSANIPQAEVDKRISELRNAYRNSGAKGFWQNVIEHDMEDARNSGRETDPHVLAGDQLRAGNKEEALNSLEKAVALGPAKTQILSLKAEPVWDPLRAEPRFKEILRKIGIPE
ncbi:MAG TPA: tetratricopeptide repeat protein [Pyrinomonadaceae bacterium]|nr:tetratricopeptide repeat protein [Pyrinomonadaceae bacterium]